MNRINQFISEFNLLHKAMNDKADANIEGFGHLLNYMRKRDKIVEYYYEQLDVIRELRNTLVHEKVSVDFELAIPKGEFGMHIHETGQATAPDFEDADSHWNPTDVEHGTESETGPHLGDLPNITVDSSGEVSGEEVIEGATLAEEAEEGEHSLYNDGQGTALIVHTEADDYVSQPTGDAGDRQLGGVIIPTEEENSGEETE